MLACRNEERVCRALWPNGFPDSLGGDCYHIVVVLVSQCTVEQNFIKQFSNMYVKPISGMALATFDCRMGVKMRRESGGCCGLMASLILWGVTATI